MTEPTYTRRQVVEDMLAGMDDLDQAQRALDRERAIRAGMGRTGEGRQVVAEFLDAQDSMGHEAVLELTDGEPTTLADALRRYLAQINTDGVPVGAEYDLAAILEYPWPAEEERLASHGVNSSVRLSMVEDENRDLVVRLGSNNWPVARVSWEDAGSGGIQAARDALNALYRALLGRVIADRDHHVQLNSSDRRALLAWLERPSGSWISDNPSRVTLDAVEGGGVLVRTRPYTYQHAHNTELRYLRES